MDLCDSDFIFILHSSCVLPILLNACNTIVSLEHTVIDDLKWFIELDITINFPNNVILHEN